MANTLKRWWKQLTCAHNDHKVQTHFSFSPEKYKSSNLCWTPPPSSLLQNHPKRSPLQEIRFCPEFPASTRLVYVDEAFALGTQVRGWDSVRVIPLKGTIKIVFFSLSGCFGRPLQRICLSIGVHVLVERFFFSFLFLSSIAKNMKQKTNVIVLWYQWLMGGWYTDSSPPFHSTSIFHSTLGDSHLLLVFSYYWLTLLIVVLSIPSYLVLEKSSSQLF